MEEKYVVVQGIKTYYRTAGAGQPVLLLHGLGANWEMWGKLIPYLQGKYKVYALDLPGSGLSAKPDVSYDIDFYADFLAAFIDTLALDRPILIGESMGGHMAVKLALRRPTVVDKLVLVASSGLSPLYAGLFKIPGVAWIFTFLAGHWQTFNLLIYRRFFADKHYVSAGVVWEYLHRLKMPGAKRAYYRNLMAERSAEKGLDRQLDEIRIPTLVVWGYNDKIMPLKDAYKFTEKIKDSRLVVVKNCGHVPPVEKYREFNRAVLDFLNIYEK